MINIIILVVFAILVFMNLIAKMILSCYDWFNFILSNLVLIHTAVILIALQTQKIPTRFRVSLSATFSLFGLILFLISQFSVHRVKDNIVILLLLILSIIQWLIFAIIYFSKHLVKED